MYISQRLDENYCTSLLESCIAVMSLLFFTACKLEKCHVCDEKTNDTSLLFSLPEEGAY